MWSPRCAPWPLRHAPGASKPSRARQQRCHRRMGQGRLRLGRDARSRLRSRVAGVERATGRCGQLSGSAGDDLARLGEDQPSVSCGSGADPGSGGTRLDRNPQHGSPRFVGWSRCSPPTPPCISGFRLAEAEMQERHIPRRRRVPGCRASRVPVTPVFTNLAGLCGSLRAASWRNRSKRLKNTAIHHAWPKRERSGFPGRGAVHERRIPGRAAGVPASAHEGTRHSWAAKRCGKRRTPAGSAEICPPPTRS